MNDICKTNLSIYAFIAVETLYLEGRSDLIMMQNSWWITNAIKYFNEIGKITMFIKKFSSLLTSNRKGNYTGYVLWAIVRLCVLSNHDATLKQIKMSRNKTLFRSSRRSWKNQNRLKLVDVSSKCYFHKLIFYKTFSTNNISSFQWKSVDSVPSAISHTLLPPFLQTSLQVQN